MTSSNASYASPNISTGDRITYVWSEADIEACLAAFASAFQSKGTPMNRKRIREVFLTHGFSIKPGCDDLLPYVYQAAEALLEAHRQDYVLPVLQASLSALDASLLNGQLSAPVKSSILAARNSLATFLSMSPVAYSSDPRVQTVCQILNSNDPAPDGVAHEAFVAKRILAALQTPHTFQIGDRVRKTKGSEWQGIVVGHYSTRLTPEGYAVESEQHAGSVQIYPASALERIAT